MKKKTLININLDTKVPLIEVGDPEVVSGSRYTADKSFTDTGWHCHNMAVIGFMEAGLVGIRTEQKSMVLSSGMMVFIPKSNVHLEAGMGAEITGWFLCLPDERVKFMPKKLCVLGSSDLLLLICKRISSWGLVKCSEKSPSQKRLVLAFLDELALAKETDLLTIPLPHQSALILVAKQIMDHPEDMQSIDHWAQVAAMSRRSFTQYFGDETGVSFARWRQLVKLHQSLKLLSRGSSVTDVALDLGYQNTSTFIAIFRKQFGMSPTRYMKMEKENTSAVSKPPQRL